MMKIIYHEGYNIDFGWLNRLHPFDGVKFRKIFQALSDLDGLTVLRPEAPVSQALIDEFVGELLVLLLNAKGYIMRALELPYIPLLPFWVIDRLILLPMRYGVAGTLLATKEVLKHAGVAWNLSGGYHHASDKQAEGFCIYNDIGISVMACRQSGELAATDRILIIDIDAHQGNGNAHLFFEQEQVTLLDIYNKDIYPYERFIKERVDIPVLLDRGSTGDVYLRGLETALQQLTGDYRLAFVVAGTDVIDSDPLGGLKLSVEDAISRDGLVLERLKALNIPSVWLGGGGYSPHSKDVVVGSISRYSPHY